MDEDRIAHEIGDVIRSQEDTEDPRLERLAAGRLSDVETKALEQEALNDPDLAEALVLYRPLSRQVHAGLEEAVHEPEAPIVLASARKSRRLWVVPPMLLAAAAILFATWTSGPGPLPAYRGNIQAGDQILRGIESPEASGPRVVRADSLLTLSMTPVSAVQGKIVAALYVRHGDRSWRADVEPQVTANGAVRVRGEVERLLKVESGVVEVALFVDREHHLPKSPQAAFASSQRPALRLKLSVRPRPAVLSP